jgi:hypothetical protein
MTDHDPYRVLTVIAETEGFTRQETDYPGANYIKGNVKLRMIRQDDPATLRIKATLPAGTRLVDVTFRLVEIPGPVVIAMVSTIVKAMGLLTDAFL